MTNPQPLRCTYCGTISTWSSEQVETTELAEASKACPGCNRETRLWDAEIGSDFEPAAGMTWAAPEPLH